MDLIENWRNAVIIKSGIIARIEDVLIGRSDVLLIDVLVFPGSSSGPVVLRPEITSISGTPAQNRSYLIGMVISYQPYIDVAVSQQTQRPRITFEENSGLASVLPTDYIAAAIVADQKNILRRSYLHRPRLLKFQHQPLPENNRAPVATRCGNSRANSGFVTAVSE
jgi:hypothetical protein